MCVHVYKCAWMVCACVYIFVYLRVRVSVFTCLRTNIKLVHKKCLISFYAYKLEKKGDIVCFESVTRPKRCVFTKKNKNSHLSFSIISKNDIKNSSKSN